MRENYWYNAITNHYSYWANGSTPDGMQHRTFYTVKDTPGIFMIDGLTTIKLDYFGGTVAAPNPGLAIATNREWRQAMARLRRAVRLGAALAGDRVDAHGVAA